MDKDDIANSYDVYLQTYIEQNERKVNGKHLKAILPGLILLFGYGAHLIWGINHMEFDDEHSSYQLRDVMLIVYYSGGIGGAFIGAGLVTIFHKKNIYNIGTAVTLTSGTLFIISHPHLIVFGRVLAGLAHGLILITTLIHAAEITSTGIQRHKLIMKLGFVLALSFLLPSILLHRNSHVVSNLMVGVQSAVMAVSAFVVNLCYTKESPYHLLTKSDPNSELESTAAFELFKLMRSDTVPAGQLHIQFEILKSHVASEKLASANIFIDGNIRSLLICIGTRLVSVLSFNFCYIYYVILLQNLAFYGHRTRSFPLILFYLICGFITTFFFSKHRKCLYLITLGISGLHFLLCICFLLNLEFIGLYMSTIPVFGGVISGLIYIYCFAMPLDVFSLIYLGEAFALSKKPISIAIVLCLEYTMHILMTYLSIFTFKPGNTVATWLITSIGLIVFSVLSYALLPRNTSQLPLENCSDVYKGKSQ